MGNEVAKQTTNWVNRAFPEIPEGTYIFEELRKAVAQSETLDSLRDPIRIMNEDIDTTTDVNKCLQKMTAVVNVVETIFSLPGLDISIPSTISKMLTIIQGGYTCFFSRKDLKLYSELQCYEDSELRSEALGIENNFSLTTAYLNEIEFDAPETVVNTIENTIPINHCVKFLGKLKVKTQDLLRSSDVVSFRRASTYMNIYFRFALFKTLVLWQVFCIKMRSRKGKASARGILAMIQESKKHDMKMLQNITNAKIANLMFHTNFHPTENEHLLNFLRVFEQDCTFVKIYQKNNFEIRPQTLFIRSAIFLDRMIKMPEEIEEGIGVTNKNTCACEFSLEPVQNREWDNVYFLKSTLFEYYIYMRENNYCYSAKKKPDSKGQWKVIRFGNESGCTQVIFSSLKWPDRYLYVYKGILRFKWWLAGTADLNLVIKKGLWRLSGL